MRLCFLKSLATRVNHFTDTSLDLKFVSQYLILSQISRIFYLQACRFPVLINQSCSSFHTATTSSVSSSSFSISRRTKHGPAARQTPAALGTASNGVGECRLRRRPTPRSTIPPPPANARASTATERADGPLSGPPSGRRARPRGDRRILCEIDDWGRYRCHPGPAENQPAEAGAPDKEVRTRHGPITRRLAEILRKEGIGSSGISIRQPCPFRQSCANCHVLKPFCSPSKV